MSLESFPHQEPSRLSWRGGAAADYPLPLGSFIYTPNSKYQNIFPLANTFAKRENVRLGQSPTGTQMVSISTFLNQAWARH